MRTMRRSVAALAILPLAAGLVACSTPEAPAADPDSLDSITSIEDLDLTGEKIRVVVSPPDVLATTLEKLLDTLSDYGAEVDRVEVLSTTGLQALIANQVDFATNGADELVLGAANGTGITAIASHRQKMDYIMAVAPGITSLEDLAGKTLGVSSPTGFDANLSRLLLAQAGVDVNKVNIVQIGNSGDRAAALVGGRIDAATIFLSTWLSIEDSGKADELVRVSDELDVSPKEAIYGLPAYIDSHPKVAVAVACANLESNRWFTDHKDEWIEKALDFVPDATEQEVSQMYDLASEVGMYPTEASELLVPEGLQALADAMLENGDIPTAVDTSTIIDHTYLDKAAEIGCGAAG
jgi:ABC-type nitrate/sulfonate/bicarbonate transport system substrate-binding protein